MSRRGRKALASWIFVYASLIAAVILMAKTGTAASRSPVNVSPVAIGEQAPAFRFDSVATRSDI